VRAVFHTSVGSPSSRSRTSRGRYGSSSQARASVRLGAAALGALPQVSKRRITDVLTASTSSSWTAGRRCPGLWGDAISSKTGEILQIGRANPSRTLSVLVKVLSRSQKQPLSRTFRADARTRTGDPFITRERGVRDGRPLAGTIGHVFAAKSAVAGFSWWTRVPARAQADVPVS
jgi:hypothetical protein